MVDVFAPVIEGGFSVTVIPAAALVVRLTAELNPFATAVDTVDVPLLPAATVSELEPMPSAKSGRGAAGA